MTSALSMTKQQHDLNRIGAWDGEKRAFRRNQSIRNQGVKMGMEAGGIVAIGLQGSDHAGEPSAVHGGILEVQSHFSISSQVKGRARGRTRSRGCRSSNPEVPIRGGRTGNSPEGPWSTTRLGQPARFRTAVPPDLSIGS
jgi:hypothetical protein